MTDIPRVCKYCGADFLHTPGNPIRTPSYCPPHRSRYYHSRVRDGRTPLTGYQDIRPGRQYKIPTVNGPLLRNINKSWFYS